MKWRALKPEEMEMLGKLLRSLEGRSAPAFLEKEALSQLAVAILALQAIYAEQDRRVEG